MILDWLIDVDGSRYGSIWWGDDERGYVSCVILGCWLIGVTIYSAGDAKQYALIAILRICEWCSMIQLFVHNNLMHQEPHQTHC